MRGILSGAPGPAAIRLMLGTHLLLLVQAALVLWSEPCLAPPLRMLVGLVLVIAAGALCAAIHGGRVHDDHRAGRNRRHAR